MRAFLLILFGTCAVLNAALFGYDVYTDAWGFAALDGGFSLASVAMFLCVKSDS
jgi:glycerol uptake facilitator-like aquaporin